MQLSILDENVFHTKKFHIFLLYNCCDFILNPFNSYKKGFVDRTFFPLLRDAFFSYPFHYS